MFSGPAATHLVWSIVTRLGEAQVLLPAALAVAAWLALRARAGRMAAVWLGLLGLAMFVTTATKVAFIGWGVGSAALNFTGVSGHSMFATAIYPLVFRGMVSDMSERAQRRAIVAGYGLALVVAASRVMVQAHSVSEAAAGLALGGAASALALWCAEVPSAPAPRFLAAGFVAWILISQTGTQPLPTHSLVTRLALQLSGHTTPYTRQDLRRGAERQPLH